MSNLLTDVFFAPEEAEKLRTVEEIPLARLRELAKAEREGKIRIGSDWTPCAEGLPENNKPCYVTVKKTWENGTSNLYVLDGYYAKGSWFDKGGWKINSHGAYPWDCDAIAWKLNVAPAPYRADDTTGKTDHIVDTNKKIDQDDVSRWPEWKKRAAMCNYELGKED